MAQPPVTIIPQSDPLQQAAQMAAATLLRAARAVSAGQGDLRNSSALSLAMQSLVLTEPEGFPPNDVLNALSGTTAWALHLISPIARAAVLESMTRQILVLANDSEQAERLNRVTPAGRA